MEIDPPTKTQPAPHSQSPVEMKRVIEAEHAGLPFLVWRDDQHVQHIFVLEARRRHTVGRSASNDIVIADEQVSRVHAELEPVADDWAVADQGLSRNGTFLQEEQLLGRRCLVDEDMLRFGTTFVRYRRPTIKSTVATVSAPPFVKALTERQRLILIALVRPCKLGAPGAVPASNAAVAKEVHLGLDAVKGHLGVLYRLFDIDHLPRNQKRARLVECALRWGLVSERDL
jgi:FHA domain